MKTTGVSRRIDDLGRIVIPKEIRKNLKIRNGELLAIMVSDETIMLSKHSTMKGIKDIAQSIIDVIDDSLKTNMIITDRDTIIAISSSLRKKYVDLNLSVQYSEMFLKRQPIISQISSKIRINNEFEEEATYTMYPIIADSDVAGSVIILEFDNKVTEADSKIVEIVSKFLSKNILY